MAYNAAASCVHVAQVNQDINGKTEGCEECEKTGSEWVHLRLCLTCVAMGLIVGLTFISLNEEIFAETAKNNTVVIANTEQEKKHLEIFDNLDFNAWNK